jgi:hypothetical protein
MAKKISKKTQPEAANAAIEAPTKKAPARKRSAKKTDAAAPAAPVDQDIKPAAPALTLDYPQKGEVVTSASYTLRLSVPEGASYVEVSVDGGAWSGCRFSVGHWWYDWADYSDGKHVIVARAVTQDGREAELQRSTTVARGQSDLLR